jgi:hypothetical protein
MDKITTMVETSSTTGLVKLMWQIHQDLPPSSGDFNMVMDDQCLFHRDTNHTMRECE